MKEENFHQDNNSSFSVSLLYIPLCSCFQLCRLKFFLAPWSEKWEGCSCEVNSNSSEGLLKLPFHTLSELDRLLKDRYFIIQFQWLCRQYVRNEQGEWGCNVFPLKQNLT